jgi:hypothetical protein
MHWGSLWCPIFGRIEFGGDVLKELIKCHVAHKHSKRNETSTTTTTLITLTKFLRGKKTRRVVQLNFRSDWGVSLTQNTPVGAEELMYKLMNLRRRICRCSID